MLTRKSRTLKFFSRLQSRTFPGIGGHPTIWCVCMCEMVVKGSLLISSFPLCNSSSISLVTDFPQGVRECQEPELALEHLLKERRQLLKDQEEFQVGHQWFCFFLLLPFYLLCWATTSELPLRFQARLAQFCACKLLIYGGVSYVLTRKGSCNEEERRCKGMDTHSSFFFALRSENLWVFGEKKHNRFQNDLISQQPADHVYFEIYATLSFLVWQKLLLFSSVPLLLFLGTRGR